MFFFIFHFATTTKIRKSWDWARTSDHLIVTSTPTIYFLLFFYNIENLFLCIFWHVVRWIVLIAFQKLFDKWSFLPQKESPTKISVLKKEKLFKQLHSVKNQMLVVIDWLLFLSLFFQLKINLKRWKLSSRFELLWSNWKIEWKRVIPITKGVKISI